MKINFGVGTGRNQSIDAIKGHARLAEDLGYEHITFIDSQNLCRDVYVMMTLAALETSNIRIGQGVTNPYTRHWTVTANATATINELSGGRAFIGLGAGMSSVGTLGMKARPLSALKDTVVSMRTMINGGDVDVAGHAVRSEWSTKPVPIFVGSQGPKSMRQAAGMADGIICPSADPTIYRWRREIITQGAEEAGRDPASIPVWARTMCYVGDTREECRRETRSYAATCAAGFYGSVLSRPTPQSEELCRRLDPQLLDEIKKVYDNYDYYEHERTDAPHGELVTDRVIDAFLLVGTADEVAERISNLAEAGCRTVSMTDYTIIDKQGQMRRVAEQILPRFAA
jgi:5,10-methylenetetrahydromethanopterin reductase